MEDPLAPLLPCERKPRLRRLQHTARPHKILRGVSGRGLAIVGSIKRPLRRPRASSAASAVLDASGAALLRSACGRMQDAQIARARRAMQHTEACNPPQRTRMSASAFRVWCTADAALVDSRRVAPVRDMPRLPCTLFPPPLRGITIVIPRSHSIFTASAGVPPGACRARPTRWYSGCCCNLPSTDWALACSCACALAELVCPPRLSALRKQHTSADPCSPLSPVSRPDMFQLLRLATQQLAFGDESKCPFSRSRPTRPRSAPMHRLGQRVLDASAIAGPTRRRCGVHHGRGRFCVACSAAGVRLRWYRSRGSRNLAGEGWRRETRRIVVCSPAVIPPCGALSLLAGQAGCY